MCWEKKHDLTDKTAVFGIYTTAIPKDKLVQVYKEGRSPKFGEENECFS